MEHGDLGQHRGANVGQVAWGRAQERVSLGNKLPDATCRNAALRSRLDVMDVDVSPCLTPSAGLLGTGSLQKAPSPLAWLGDAFTSHLGSHGEITSRKAEPGTCVCHGSR